MLTGKKIKKEARSATGRDTGKSELHHLRCRVVSFSEPPHLKISIESPLGPSLCLSFSSCREFVGCVFGFMWGWSGGRTWRCYFIPGAASTSRLSKRRKLCLPCPAVVSPGRKQSVFPGPLTVIILLFGFYYMLNSLQFPGSSFENF